MNDLVSVIIPTYSRNDQLIRAIESVQNQTYKNIEILVIDDNPADSEWRIKTEKLMKKYENDSRVRYMKNPYNMGGAGARNEGIRAATGEYLAFLDDDDYYYPQKVEKQLLMFLQSDNEKLALVYCYAECIDKEGKVIHVYRENYRGNCLYEAIRYSCIASTSRWMVRKSCLQMVGNFSIVPSQQDSTVILKLLEQGYELDCVEEILSCYDDSGSLRISMGSVKNIEGLRMYKERCMKNYNNFDLDQILEIEFMFAYKFFWLNDKNGFTAERNKQLKWMLKCNFFKSLYMVSKYYLNKLKNCMLKVSANK